LIIAVTQGASNQQTTAAFSNGGARQLPQTPARHDFHSSRICLFDHPPSYYSFARLRGGGAH